MGTVNLDLHDDDEATTNNAIIPSNESLYKHAQMWEKENWDPEVPQRMMQEALASLYSSDK